MKNENRWGSTLTQRAHEGERGTSGLRIGFQTRLHVILFVFYTHSTLYFNLNYTILHTWHRGRHQVDGGGNSRDSLQERNKTPAPQAANFLHLDVWQSAIEKWKQLGIDSYTQWPRGWEGHIGLEDWLPTPFSCLSLRVGWKWLASPTLAVRGVSDVG